MSHGSENDDSSSVLDSADTSVTGLLRNRFELPILALVVAVMLWIRLQSFDRFVRDGEVFFAGNDAWYHLREVQYTVRNWPFTMPFDIWTNFPRGTSVGQFGTLYDQLVATAALIVGLGSPSSELVAQTLLVAPAVAGALTAIPTYYVAKRVAGRIPGLFAAVVLMLLPGTFLRRTLVGFADHNGVEPLFQTVAVAGILLAVTAGQRDRPIWELVTAGDWDALREPAAYSAVAGTAIGLYLWVWPPGILLLGVFGVYVVLQILSDYAGGRPPDHTAFVAAVTMAVTAGMSLVQLETLGFETTRFGILHPTFALAVGGGAVGLAWLARQFESREFDNEWVNRNGFPAAVVGLVAVAFLAVATLNVQPFGLIRGNLLRFVGFSISEGQRTIGEAQPFLASNRAEIFGDGGAILLQYGFTFVTAVIGAVWTMAAPLWNRNEEGDRTFLGVVAFVVVIVFAGWAGLPDLFGETTDLFGLDEQLAGLAVITALVFAATVRIRYDAQKLFLFVWAAFITMAAFTQVRFNYYLAVSVAVFNAVFVKRALGLANVELGDRIDTPEVETYQVLAVLAVVSLILVPVLSVPLTLESAQGPSETRTAVQVGNSTDPGPVVVWDESLSWMQENTPAQGTLGGAGEPVDYYETTPRPANGDFEYADGSYGVQSWWDYGHWITTRAERAPNANPFQEGATAAADFLLAQNETEAQQALTSRGTDGETRYVMVDWKMATASPFARADSKYTAPLSFTTKDVNNSDYFDSVRTSQGQFATLERKQPFYESMSYRLYYHHGSRVDSQIQAGFFSQVVVFDWDVRQFTDRTTGEQITSKTLPDGQNATAFRTFPNRTAAEEFVEEDGTAKIGGIGPYPNEPVPALEHYRLVHVSNTSATQAATYRAALRAQLRASGIPNPQFLLPTSPRWVKTFEKVPGATIEGSGAAPNATVTARVQMEVPPPSPNANATSFVYTQQATADENGEFTLTVPYSTTGYDQYGPENGYTNVSVRAAGPYQISGEFTQNDSGFVLQNSTTLNVSEGVVNGDRDETVQVTLEEEVLQRPEGAQNESAGNETTNATDPVPIESVGVTDTTTDDVAVASESPDVTASSVWARVVRDRHVIG